MKFRSGESGEGSKDVIKFKAGETVVGTLRGEPWETYLHWIDKRPNPCPGKDNCPWCQKGDKAKFRFKLNFIVQENGALTPKILEGGWKLYQQLANLHSAGWDLESRAISITRTGQGMNDTFYSATPCPGAEHNAAMKKQLDSIRLHDFAAKTAQPEVSDSNEDLSF